MTRRLNAFLFGLLLVSAVCFAVQDAASVPDDEAIRRILVERIDEQKRSVGIVVGVVEPGGRRVVAHGQLATANPTEVDGNTVFEIGSITKAFTAILLADLAGEGVLELQTPVQRLLGPDVTVPTRNGAEITLLHLTTHGSGLPRMPDNFRPADGANPYADYTVAQLYEFLASHELGRDIGEAVEYSNLGTGLLGHALALSQETDYETLVSERLLKPLGMSDTSITLSPSQRERLAIGHSVQLRPVANWDLPTLAGAGALRSTVNDMLTFAEANLGVRESPLREEMAETHRSRRDFSAPGMRIGLGWVIRSGHGRDLHWHNGGTGGYRSFVGFDLESQTGVVVLSNSGDSVDDLGFHLLEQGYRLVLPPAFRSAVEVDPAVFDDYVGRYQLAENVVFTVTRRGDRLFVQLTGQPSFEVFPESETKYFYRVVDAQITFGRSADGAVDHLVLHQNDMDQRADRLTDD
ncbi:MAG: serine hydrolase [Holophagales bacterium]|nr:serine hydrolase [Holophagales bacterium]MYG31069.1 serine hydrolase [Holophagales bacterium]MYI79338.1 serine hydrolase [Holophagales bacterium]